MIIADAFKDGKAFMPFITCGDPNLDITEEIIYALDEAGASLIELGIPFSDPTAEGPVIQSASERALQAGTTTDKVFNMVEKVRKKVSIPLAFMTYANVVYSYGIENFFQHSAGLNVNAVILPDVPFEEKDEFAIPCKESGIDFISLIAPTSARRVETIAKQAQGFIYLVSSLGVTGVRDQIHGDIASLVQEVRSHTAIPIAIGFGIGSARSAQEMAKYADGVIMGSAIMQLVADHGIDAPDKVYDFAREIVEALKD
ncbi:MAG: tryptophan synthase subunit alpha [Bacillota bacterium]|nr:tryptophan synthase subunit alpha [Bacillota bacterium]HHU61920.1 tryptophan synthase subunit alpha [Natronincola sp.]